MTVQNKTKCPELRKLDNYEGIQLDSLWQNFPFNPLPRKIESNVNVLALVNLTKDLKEKLNESEFRRAERLADSLRVGASSCQKSNLPQCDQKNAASTSKFVSEITDTIADWTKSGYVSRPFESPPLPRFRINSLMAVAKCNKIRPVLNVSAPAGSSFNENIDDNMLEKVKMSSARNFGFTLKSCGTDARFSKFDMKDAYKNIPAPLEDLRLQGFRWLNKFFVENKQISSGSKHMNKSFASKKDSRRVGAKY